jgi:hypothetical protein
MEAALSRAVPNTDVRLMMEFAMDSFERKFEVAELLASGFRRHFLLTDQFTPRL